jgi:hypothetical protein
MAIRRHAVSADPVLYLPKGFTGIVATHANNIIPLVFHPQLRLLDISTSRIPHSLLRSRDSMHKALDRLKRRPHRWLDSDETARHSSRCRSLLASGTLPSISGGNLGDCLVYVHRNHWCRVDGRGAGRRRVTQENGFKPPLQCRVH